MDHLMAAIQYYVVAIGRLVGTNIFPINERSVFLIEMLTM